MVSISSEPMFPSSTMKKVQSSNLERNRHIMGGVYLHRLQGHMQISLSDSVVLSRLARDISENRSKGKISIHSWWTEIKGGRLICQPAVLAVMPQEVPWAFLQGHLAIRITLKKWQRWCNAHQMYGRRKNRLKWFLFTNYKNDYFIRLALKFETKITKTMPKSSLHNIFLK